jgi:hypothetical protein
MMRKSVFQPGCKVRVVNPSHWLFDRVGNIVEMSLDGQIKHQVAGGSTRNKTVVVDFEKPRHGWFNTPLKGERRVHTHNCDGSLKYATGYYMLERDLKLEGISGGVII